MWTRSFRCPKFRQWSSVFTRHATLSIDQTNSKITLVWCFKRVIHVIATYCQNFLVHGASSNELDYAYSRGKKRTDAARLKTIGRGQRTKTAHQCRIVVMCVPTHSQVMIENILDLRSLSSTSRTLWHKESDRKKKPNPRRSSPSDTRLILAFINAFVRISMIHLWKCVTFDNRLFLFQSFRFVPLLTQPVYISYVTQLRTIVADLYPLCVYLHVNTKHKRPFPFDSNSKWFKSFFYLLAVVSIKNNCFFFLFRSFHFIGGRHCSVAKLDIEWCFVFMRLRFAFIRTTVHVFFSNKWLRSNASHANIVQSEFLAFVYSPLVGGQTYTFLP